MCVHFDSKLDSQGDTQRCGLSARGHKIDETAHRTGQSGPAENPQANYSVLDIHQELSALEHWSKTRPKQPKRGHLSR